MRGTKTRRNGSPADRLQRRARLVRACLLRAGRGGQEGVTAAGETGRTQVSETQALVVGGLPTEHTPGLLHGRSGEKKTSSEGGREKGT